METFVSFVYDKYQWRHYEN